MTANRLYDYLETMQQAAFRACRFVEGMDRDEFFDDERTQQAVAMSLLVIGESAARISEQYCDFVTEHPQIPWNSMRGMRNRIAHAYFTIDWQFVWDTVYKELPSLINAITPILLPNVDDG